MLHARMKLGSPHIGTGLMLGDLRKAQAGFAIATLLKTGTTDRATLISKLPGDEHKQTRSDLMALLEFARTVGISTSPLPDVDVCIMNRPKVNSSRWQEWCGHVDNLATLAQEELVLITTVRGNKVPRPSVGNLIKRYTAVMARKKGDAT